MIQEIFRVGVDYYPEQWPEERWSSDAQLMREAGFNVVRLAEFAWAKLEPVLGNFDFDWLDRAIEVLASHGLAVVLCTPTASPPAWVMGSDSTMYRVSSDGRAVSFGHRRGYCPHHTGYRNHSRRVVCALVDHYAQHPAVIGWQIDNEFGDRSYSSAAQHAFALWLERRYGTLDALEAAWGTVFWSQSYQAWSEIPLPLELGGPHNPGLALDFARFSSEGYVAFQREQIEVIRAACPQHFITHNLMGFSYNQLDYHDLAQDLDLISWDNYPRMWWNVKLGDDSARAALGHAAMRGLKSQNFWVMEQQAGAGGWEMVVPHPRPGELRLWAYQAIAHGADGIVFFRFRSARFGTEQYWHGLLEHDGRPGRRYQEAKRFGLELQRIGAQIVGSSVQSKVALLHDYDSRFALQIQPNNPGLGYEEQFGHWYRGLHRRQVMPDVVVSGSDLSPYALVIAPLLHLVTPGVALGLEQFVREGGTLVLTARCGVKDSRNAVVNQALPGLLRGLAGVWVEDYDSLIVSQNAVKFCIPELIETPSVPVDVWCDILEPTTATVIARYTQDHYAGRAAITQHDLGLGKVFYVGALGNDALPEAMLAGLLKPSRLDAAESPLEVTQRWQGGHCLHFYLNHGSEPQTLVLDQPATDLYTGEECFGAISLEGYGVRIFETD